MITIEEAYSKIEAAFAARLNSPVGGHWRLTQNCLGKVLDSAVKIEYDSPPYSQSAMDGFAFGFSGYTPVMECVGTVAAGDPPDQVMPRAGECVRIMTGAPMPKSCDTVVMVEHVREAGSAITLERTPDIGQHVRLRGSNARAGGLLFGAGTRCGANVVAALLSQGVRRVSVRNPPKVGVAATGEEIVPHHQPLAPGQIFNSNALSLMLALSATTDEIEDLGIFPDEMSSVTALLEHHVSLDVLVLTGGVSMGQFDFLPKAAEAAGFQCLFHKIRMKPGKPMWFGVHPSGTVLFGLPGNPVSAMVATHLFVMPLVRAMSEGRFQRPVWSTLTLSAAITNKGPRTYFAAVRPVVEEGSTRLVPVDMTGSGDVVGFGAAHTIARVPPGVTLDKGQGVEALVTMPFTG